MPLWTAFTRHYSMRRVLPCLFFLSLAPLSCALTAQPVQAGDVDPHSLYEKKCTACHEAHAGDFVHEKLKIENGVVTGLQTGRPVAATLAHGHGGLTATERAVMIAHLEEIAAAGTLYHEKCLACHDRASSMARSRLILRDNVLTGRYSGRDIASFLKGHGRLSAEQAADMTATLSRQLSPAQP